MELIMSGIKITGIDDNIKQLLKKEADREGLTINEKIRQIITENFNINNSKNDNFSEFLGLWDDDDYQEFQENTEELNKINDIDWK